MSVSIKVSLVGLSCTFNYRGILFNEGNAYFAGPCFNKSRGLEPSSRSLIRVVERGKSLRAIGFNLEYVCSLSVNINLHFVNFGETFYIFIAVSS